MAKPDHNFRPNVERGVDIFGDFDESLVAASLPRIFQLRQSGTLPITIYINSSGGSTRCLDTLRNALKTQDPDGKRSRIITVAVGVANSAAATLLSLGDYAIAYPDATVHFHGVRLSEADDLTVEKASGMATWLQEKNDATAMLLAGAFLNRLVVRYDQLKPQFEAVKKGDPHCKSDVECFAECIRKKLSVAGERVVKRAIARWRSIQELSDNVFKALKDLDPTEVVRYEAGILKEIVNFEIKQHKGMDWCLDAAGISQVVEDYTILRDYSIGEYQRFVNQITKRFAFTFLSEGEREEAKALQTKTVEEQTAWLSPKIMERIRPFVYFTVSLCRHLHERENAFTARDAYWLGAVDEVYGTNLACLRKVVENKEEPTPDLPKSPST